jgi:hypothetical protein
MGAADSFRSGEISTLRLPTIIEGDQSDPTATTSTNTPIPARVTALTSFTVPTDPPKR